MPFHICADEINLFIFMIQHYMPFFGPYVSWVHSKVRGIFRKDCVHGVHHH